MAYTPRLQGPGHLNCGRRSQVPVKLIASSLRVPATIRGNRPAFSADIASYYYNYNNLPGSSFQARPGPDQKCSTVRVSWGSDGSARLQCLTDASHQPRRRRTRHARYTSFQECALPTTYCNPLSLSFLRVSLFDCGRGDRNRASPGTQVTTDASGYHMQRSPELHTANRGAGYQPPARPVCDLTPVR